MVADHMGWELLQWSLVPAKDDTLDVPPVELSRWYLLWSEATHWGVGSGASWEGGLWCRLMPDASCDQPRGIY